MSSKTWRDAQHIGSPDGWSNEDVSKLKRRYGITPWQYLALFARQNGRCAVCKMEPSEGERLHVHHIHDHCGSTVNICCVRALLCARCNLAEGNLLAVKRKGGWLALVRLVMLWFTHG